jgi:hypothetical protein
MVKNMMHKTVSIQELAPLIQEQVNEGKQVLLTISGNSMLPFLKDRETIVTLEAIKQPLRRGDILFYRNHHHQYILHRLLHVKKDGLILRGDALMKKEYLETNQMIAIVTSYQNKGKITNLNSFWVRFKVGLWFLLTPVRPLIMKMWYFLRNRKSHL